MKKCFGYIRVSTTKQGREGVSLEEQKDAIERYAASNNIDLIEWFEEQQTAAKRGRPVFGRMLSRLRKGDAVGVVIHKIDRSARNLKDWADLGGLIDKGIEVHFATESLDLHSRGGRLSADIQAVVAADYIRNLREETRKGFYGRLKQGLYPLPAPVGYVDRGKGKTKEPDPQKAPIVRQLFELYATGRYSLLRLQEEAIKLGLTTRVGGAISINGLSTMLNNPFYAGQIRIHRTGETFEGIHKPLIPMTLFLRVRDVLSGKAQVRSTTHDYLFRKMFQCALCGRFLIAERQKGYVYYRCHTRECPTKTVREEVLSENIRNVLRKITLRPTEYDVLVEHLHEMRSDLVQLQEQAASSVKMQIGNVDDRLLRLTDAYVDGMVDKPVFEERRTALLQEKAVLGDRLLEMEQNPDGVIDAALGALELAKSAEQSYEMEFPDDKRETLDSLTSNRLVSPEKVIIEPKIQFKTLAFWRENANGDPCRDASRTCEELIKVLRSKPD